MAARNMKRREINTYMEKEFWSSWLFTKITKFFLVVYDCALTRSNSKKRRVVYNAFFVLRKLLAIQTIIFLRRVVIVDQKQLENVEYFKYLSSILTNDGRCTCEIKCRIAMAKAAFNKKRTLFTSTLGLELRKKLVKCYV
jgi:hypothetical protein